MACARQGDRQRPTSSNHGARQGYGDASADARVEVVIKPSRRRFLLGAGALLAAPAIVRVASLMAVKPVAQSNFMPAASGAQLRPGLDFATQYRQEFIRGFEERLALLRSTVTTEVDMRGDTSIYLVASPTIT